MTNLSLSAQTVKDAVLATYSPDLPPNSIWALEQAGIAAALRAAADQVAPSDAMEPRNYLPMALECQRIREELLAIADEMEAQ